MKVSAAPSSLIDELYSKKILNVMYEDLLLDIDIEPDINNYFNIKSHTNSAIVKYIAPDTFKVLSKSLNIDSIKPKDADQAALIDSLTDDTIQIVCVTGPAGAGKTFLSLAYGITELIADKSKDKKLLLTKATETVKSSKFFGAVPGGIDEKFAIFLDSFDLAIHKLLKDSAYVEMLKQSNRLMYKPIEFCRGDSRDNTILIVDESQNLDWHSTKTILTRLGEGSKAILIGDTSQKDINQFQKSGFELLVNSQGFKESPLTSHVKLINDYRGPISRLVSSIAAEIEQVN